MKRTVVSLVWIVVSCCFTTRVNHICDLGGCALCAQVCGSAIRVPVSWSWSLVNLPERNSTGHSLSPQPHLAPGMPPTPLGEGQLLLKTWCYRRPVVWLQKTVLTRLHFPQRCRELFHESQVPLCCSPAP